MVTSPVPPHCESCICGRRAPVQADHAPPKRCEGTVTWEEYLRAYAAYAALYGSSQSAERLAERGGFGYVEITTLLGHEPKTWTPRGPTWTEQRRAEARQSAWDKVGAAIDRLALVRGGPLKVVKPVVTIAWYEHDAQATVTLGSSVDVTHAHVDVFGSRAEPSANVILRALAAAEKSTRGEV